MADEQDNPTQTVRISNTTPGPRYVHTVDGPVTIAPRTTSDNLTMRTVEIDSLPEGLEVGEAVFAALDADAIGVRTADEGGPAEGVDREQGDGVNDGPVYPADLASASSNDGLIPRKDLVAIAEAENVEFESDANKPQIAQAIMAARGTADLPTS